MATQGSAAVVRGNQASNRTALYGQRPLGPDQIRLLRIQPAASSGDPLQCYLKVFSLASTPEYQALSYTWGSQPFDYFVNCNGERKPVTQSCFEALIVLRQNGCLFVWIDQLSVDQQNLRERADQVVLMFQIYSKATSVYVWLGRFDETDIRQTPGQAPSWWARQKALSVLTAGVSLIEFLAHHNTNRWPRTEEEQKLGPPRNPEILADAVAWSALIQILNRAYFGRRWIIQEIVANSTVVALIGKSQISWTAMERCCESIELYRKGYPNGLSIASKHVKQCDVLSNAFFSIYMIKDIRSLFKERSPMSLGFLLNRCKGFDVLEPQDTIYALQAITTGSASLPRPDYSLTPSQTCLQHAAQLIKNGYVRDVVPYAGRAWTPGDWDLPTWCPDWMSSVWPIYYHSNDETPGSSYSSSEPGLITISEDGMSLQVQCTFFTKASELADTTRNPAMDRLRLSGFLHRHSKKDHMTEEVRASLQVDPATNKFPGFDWEEIRRVRYANVKHCLRTLFADRELLRPGNPDALSLFEDLYSATYFSDLSAMYRLCATVEGYVGMIPDVATPTDDIVLIDGIDCLLVIRQAAPNAYQLIGDCHLLDVEPEEVKSIVDGRATSIEIV